MGEIKNNETVPPVSGGDPQDSMMRRVGAAAAVAMLSAGKAASQSSSPGPAVITHSGWKNDANRISGNGPMDGTTRQIVKYVTSFSESNLTPPVLDAVNNIMVDSMASLVAGFESEPARICARIARTEQSDLKATVLGYGIITSPEVASFANGCMLRNTDFNDLGPGGHVSDIISGPLAIGEALHSSGTQVLVAITLGYEIAGALAATGGGGVGWDGPFEGPATAMAVGKLMGLNEDQLANALSLSLVPNVPMSVTHIGALSHWKGCHSSEAVRSAVWAAMMAREGMTGPCQPFEARNGWWDHNGPFKNPLKIPWSPDGKMNVQLMGFKRTPSEGSTQAILESIPALRQFTKAEDIAAIHIEMGFGGWQEIGDPPKWDPRNRETADHSMPYVIARALMDGDIYMDSFDEKKFMDPAARRLMEKITISQSPECVGLGPYRITVRTKAGKEMTKEWLPKSHGAGEFHTAMTHEEIVAKFNRACKFMSMADDQRERALKAWSNLRAVRDIAEPMQDWAKFGKPKPL